MKTQCRLNHGKRWKFMEVRDSIKRSGLLPDDNGAYNWRVFLITPCSTLDTSGNTLPAGRVRVVGLRDTGMNILKAETIITKKAVYIRVRKKQ